MDEQCAEVPLVELLESTPADARMWYEHGPTNHQHIPVGSHAQRAAAEIRSLQSKLDGFRSYVRHKTNCYSYVEKPCTCGLDALITGGVPKP